MKSVGELNSELEKLQQQRADVAAKRAELVQKRDSVDLPVDIAKASAVLTELDTQVSAAERLLTQLSAKIGEVTEQRNAAQAAENRLKALALDGDCAKIESDILQQLAALEKLIGTYKSNRLQHAQVLGRVAHPDNKYGLFESATATLRSNAALAAAFSQK